MFKMHQNNNLKFKACANFYNSSKFFLILLLLMTYLPLSAQETERKVIEQNFDSEEESKTEKSAVEGNQVNDSAEQSGEEKTVEEEQADENQENKEEVQIESPAEHGVNIYNEGSEEDKPSSDSEERTFTDEDKSETKAQKPTILKGHISKVPVGTKLKIILETPVDEITSMVDDEIVARASENIEIDGMIIIPAGSTVVGKISEINPAKRLHKAGSVRIEFKNLTMPDGREVPILASVLTHSGLIKGKYTKKAALISGATIIGPAAAGFGAGLAAEGSLVGAGIGATVGTLAGLGIFAFQRGNMVDLKSGDELNIELTEDALVPSNEAEESNEDFCEIKK